MPSWSSGRVTLVGDAGYCASPLSGMGTSLALVGAYILAGELGPADSLDAERIRAALERYGTKMRPYVDKCQDLPNTIDRYAPKSASDIAINALAMKWMQRWPFRSFAEKKWFTTADAVDLPEYTTPSV
jgi:2-polyprenyl-6-methoxyphenol hydroxylase-like FAD-dependent oxidoreductase